MLKELNIFEVYLSPILLYLVLGVLVWWPLRWILQKAGAYKHVWHAPLFNTALYVILVAVIFACLK